MAIILDSHLDLAWNMASLGRDYTHSAAETRRLEHGSFIPGRIGDTLLGWPDFQRGQVAVVFATLFASPRRLVKAEDAGWDTQAYADAEEAHRVYRAQLDAYHRLADEHPDQFRLVGNRADLSAVLARWLQPTTGEESEGEDPPARPVGLVPLMEGAEGVRSPDELEAWWQAGIRIIGPAWAGTRFCGGTHEPGPLTAEGFALLEAMAAGGFTLDLSHMDVAAALQSLEAYPGAIIAGHANPQGMLPGYTGNRHLPDRVIEGLIERDGMIGIVLANAFLKAGWRKGDPREAVSLRDVVAHIDYVCQMAGDARHVGLGSDLDGGFGLQSTPIEMDTIADLQKLDGLLAEKGYSEDDIRAILGGNWIAFLERTLPE